MPLSSGVRLGPYEITEPLGSGGMGDVYGAIDRRLHRRVAIKMVAERHRDRPDLRQRFKIETAAIAALNHPHICQLYDVGEHEGADYVVMELVEGETLAARLARGRVPLEHALRFACEIADALDAAHRRGILHRDLKPANVMLTAAGVKLLDFGLARMQVVDRTAVAAVSTVTAAGPLTDIGTPVGTWPYMAPEQIRGEEPDARTDVFALGVVTYEMLAGRCPFVGATHAELVAAILDGHPTPLTAATPPIAAAVDRVVRTCLAKNRDDRWQSAGDVRRALETIGVPEASASVEPSRVEPTRVEPARASGGRWAWGLGGIVLMAVVAAALSMPAATDPLPSRVVRSTLLAGTEVLNGAGDIAFSPDGQTVAFVGRRAGPRWTLMLRRLDADVSVPLEGAFGRAPFFSPDGQWVGFCSSNRLVKVPITGGRPTPLTDVQGCYGASWGEDGAIVYSPGNESGLRRVAPSGGEPTEVTALLPEDNGNDHRYPQVLPGGRGILFTVGTGPEDAARIMVLDSRTGSRKEVLRGSASARYVPSGHLVYARNGELRAMPFDLARLEATGLPVKIADGVTEDNDGAPEYTFAANGDLMFVPGQPGGPQNRLVMVDMTGAVRPLNLPPAPYFRPRVSPDGSTIAISRAGAKNSVGLYDLRRATYKRVTFGRYHTPIWLPDGRLIMAQGGEGNSRLVRRAADGSGDDEPLTAPVPGLRPYTSSPDGATVIYGASGDAPLALWSLTLETLQARRVSTSPFSEGDARVSPDGRWLAYVSAESGRTQLYVRAMDRGAQRELVSADEAVYAVWAPDGRRLYYRDWPRGGPRSGTSLAPGAMRSVDVETSPSLRVGRPQLLFSADGLGGNFDITPDGKHFVMVQLDPTPEPERLELVQNWTRLVPSPFAR